MSLRKTMSIIIPDFPQAAAVIQSPLNKSIKAEISGYTSDMLMCRNGKAANNYPHLESGIQRK